MASVSAPPFPSPSTQTDAKSLNFSLRNPNFFASSRYSPPLKKSTAHIPSSPAFRASESAICRCQNRSDSPPPDDYVNRRWDSAFQEVVRKAIRRFDDYVNSYWNQPKNSSSVDKIENEKEEIKDWDWDRWMKHFKEVEEQERIVSVLKSQLTDAVHKEDYEDAAKLKVVIAAAATNDIVGRVISHLNKAIEEEHYWDAAFLRDHAGVGLMGWWAGISDDSNDPYGRIIHISAENGRYVARGYSPRQLATATTGVPLFEVFLTMNERGEYKQQAVYLKRSREDFGDTQTKLLKSSVSSSSSSSISLNPLDDSIDGSSDLSATGIEDIKTTEDRDEDSDVVEGLSGFQNILRDMIPGVRVRVLKVTAPGKVDRDLISKVIEQIMEEEDEEKDVEEESVETEDEVKAESDQDQDDIEIDATDVISDSGEERSELAVKVVIGGLVQNLSDNVPSKDLLRVPAILKKKGRSSFSFSIEKDGSRRETGVKRQASPDKNAHLRGQRSIDRVMSDLAKFIIKREKIPMKVLKDVGDLINLTLSQAQNHQPLSGSTTFNRIETPASSDPLNGLYIGAHGLYTSEIIHLRRKIGQWKEDGETQKSSNIEFYEYVEAFKLTGDPYVPAGEVAFRAKVGKRYQLPHKGIIPEEFGVIARYRGQGRLAEPGFQNPRWVDGELVILDGKYIKGGPVVGFVYWAPEYHFLVFFNRLTLQG